MSHRRLVAFALHSFMDTVHPAHVLWASTMQSWPVPTHPSLGTTLIGWAGAPAGWCYPREGGARRETLCLAARKSNCHNLATDESALPNLGWLPSVHILSDYL